MGLYAVFKPIFSFTRFTLFLSVNFSSRRNATSKAVDGFQDVMMFSTSTIGLLTTITPMFFKFSCLLGFRLYVVPSLFFSMPLFATGNAPVQIDATISPFYEMN